MVSQSESAKKQAALDQWRNAFRDEAKGGDPDPGLVLDSLLALRSVERKLHEQVTQQEPHCHRTRQPFLICIKRDRHPSAFSSSTR
jgi:signal-transduction protein with cAMP-binding, CBS, and nucleotidyltransferase domain